MAQLGSFLRSTAGGGHAHWCPACGQLHVIPGKGWTFDGDKAAPTFEPSVKIHGIKKDAKTWEWERDAAGKPVPFECHYHLRAGKLHFYPDSSHAMAGQIVALPPLPGWLADSDTF